jgi:hypothetical protein
MPYAVGSFVAADRPRALDLLGFKSQLVFNTFANQHLLAAEHGDDLDFAYGIARAYNRTIVDFCTADPRLLAVGYVPLAVEGSFLLRQLRRSDGAGARTPLTRP